MMKNWKQFNESKDLSDEWTHDIVEYLTSHYGNAKDHGELYDLIKEVVDMALSAKSFISFREFLDYHNPKFHEEKKSGNYKNLWWGKVQYLLGKSDKIEKDGVGEGFMYKVIDMMDHAVDMRQEIKE